MASISLSNVAANLRTIEVDLGIPPTEDGTPQTLTVTYRVNTLTLNDQARFTGMSADAELTPEELAWFVGLFKRLLVSWGVTGPMYAEDGAVLFPEGEPVPITAETLKLIDVVTLMTIFSSCMRDTKDPKASTATDGATKTPN